MSKNNVIFLGRKFYTDDDKLYDYLNRIIRGGDPYLKFDNDQFDKEFPGVKNAAMEAIKDMDNKRMRAEKLVYFNGVMQAWCMTGFGDPKTGLPHPPGKLCPNKHLYSVEL